MDNLLDKTLNFLKNRKRDYQLIFNGHSGQEVLRDLATFCRANETCFDVDPRKHALCEGRREVWLRIQQHLNLTPEEMYLLYSGKNFIRKTQEEINV